MQLKLEGAIAELIGDLFCINDGFSAGEKLTQIEKTAKKKFYDLTNQEIYDALKTTIKSDYYSDTFYTD
jgi:hypothetical protein